MEFPFLINGVAEQDIAIKIFACMAHFDTNTLLMCRAVSKSWRDAVDSHTLLWSRPGYGVSLLRAVRDNRDDICQLLVTHAKDIDKNMRGNGGALHLAARQGYTDICRLILDRVDNKNPGNNYGSTPLHGAAGSGHIDVVCLFLDRVDDKNPQDCRGESPLSLAENPSLYRGEISLSLDEHNRYTEICQLIRTAIHNQK